MIYRISHVEHPAFPEQDLANLVNEAALQSARSNHDAVTMADFESARDKLKWGKERRSKVMTEDDRKIAAYHEAGHALALFLLPDTEPLHKVTIIPRGVDFLGTTMQLPKNDRYTKTKRQLLCEISALMAGRAAEEIVFNDCSTGASSDIQVASRLARLMVCEWGMSKILGPIRYGNLENLLNKPDDAFAKLMCSETVAREIDDEIKKIIDVAYDQAHQLLYDHRETLVALAERLLRNEVLDIKEIEMIIENYAQTSTAASNEYNDV